MRGLYLSAAMVLLAPSAQASFVVTYGDPGDQNSKANFYFKGVETFDGQTTGTGKNFTTDFGTGGVITGQYSNVQINNPDQYGAAGGTGKYAVTFTRNGPYTLKLQTTDARGINFFGYWLSALDRGNMLSFYRGAQKVFSFTPTDVLKALKDKLAYFGNPVQRFLGQNKREPYSFVNVYAVGETFDTVEFSEDAYAGGYESDNHTVGFWQPPIDGHEVPEPGTLAVFGMGLGGVLIGRRGRRKA